MLSKTKNKHITGTFDDAFQISLKQESTNFNYNLQICDILGEDPLEITLFDQLG